MRRARPRLTVLSLFVLATACDGSPSGPSASSAIALTPGVAIAGLSGAPNSRKLYKVLVPSGTPILTVETSGGRGDVDVLVRRERVPTLVVADCDSFNTGNSDGCSITSPGAGTYYILLFSGSNDDSGYSGVTLIATFAPHS